MTNISFDREALGIVGKAQWTDSEDLGQVGAALNKLETNGAALPLPDRTDTGITALRDALVNFRLYMSIAILEFSDACAELGSGVADFSKNQDSTETYNESKARQAASRLGLEGGL